MSTPFLEARDIRKTFGAVTALDGVDFTCARGEVQALLGENGAGKSTLMHVVSGLITFDAGELRLDGRAVRWRSPEDARSAGVGMVHQHFMLVPTMTVAENVALARGDLGFLGPNRLVAQVEELAHARGFDVGDPRRPIEDLSVGEQQRVEILKALVAPTRLLILDEPTAVLTPAEVEGLFDVLRRLARDGTAIAIVTHKLAEALSLADSITVLRAGRVVARGRAAELDAETLAERMVGASSGWASRAEGGEVLPAREERGAGDAALLVSKLSVPRAGGAPALDGVSLQVRAGEVMVIAGVEGNGQAELVAALCGIRRPGASGIVRICGRDIGSPADARAAGLALVPPDRRREGLVEDLELWENLLLVWPELRRVAPHGVIARRSALARAERLLQAYAVRPGAPRALANALSGGNQQRLVLARELERGERTVIVAANPSRGLDVAATAAVHMRLEQSAREGAAVLVLSTDLDEVEALAGGVAVLYRGHLRGPVASFDRAEVGRLMAGAG